MPNTIKYSTSGDTQSLKKGNFFIGVGDVPKGPSSRTNHWQGITPPTSGYTIYINSGSGSTAIMTPENDAKLVEYANGMNNNTNYFTNGGNFSNGTISPFNSSYNQAYGTSYVVNISNDKPYSGSSSNYAMFFNYGGGRMMGTDGMLTTGVTYTFSFWAKLLSGTTMTVSWNNQNGSGETNAWTSNATLTTEWKRYIQTFTYNLPRTRFYFSTANPSNPERAAIFTEFQVSTGTTYGGPGLQNATEALNWFSSVSQDEVCVNRDYESIVTDGLSLNIDAGFTPSYPRTGTTWYDLAYSGNNSNLINGTTFVQSGGGSIVFDGTDDYANFTFPNNLITPTFTVCSVITPIAVAGNGTVVFTNESARLNLGIAYGGNNGGYFFVAGNNGQSINGVFGSYGFSYGTNTKYFATWIVDIPGKNFQFWVNGSLVGSSNADLGTNFSNTSTNGFVLASRYGGGSSRVNIGISNFQFYNRVLTSNEIVNNYNVYKSRFGI